MEFYPSEPDYVMGDGELDRKLLAAGLEME